MDSHAQTCELQNTSEHPLRLGERDTVNMKQSQVWQSCQTMLRSGDYVATRMSGHTLLCNNTRTKKSDARYNLGGNTGWLRAQTVGILKGCAHKNK